jgi:hypothetical protein
VRKLVVGYSGRVFPGRRALQIRVTVVLVVGGGSGRVLSGRRALQIRVIEVPSTLFETDRVIDTYFALLKSKEIIEVLWERRFHSPVDAVRRVPVGFIRSDGWGPSPPVKRVAAMLVIMRRRWSFT